MEEAGVVAGTRPTSREASRKDLTLHKALQGQVQVCAPTSASSSFLNHPSRTGTGKRSAEPVLIRSTPLATQHDAVA